MVKFRIIRSARRGAKKPFIILKDGQIVGRTRQIGLDLRPAKKRRRR